MPAYVDCSAAAIARRSKGPRVQRPRAHLVPFGARDGTRLTGEGRLVEDGRGALHQAVHRDDLAGLDHEPVADDHGVDRTRDELAVLVAVDIARRPAQERRQLAMRAPLRVPLERLAGGEHQGDDSGCEGLFHRQRAADREDGDDIHARLAGQQIAEDRPGKADPHDPGRHDPGDRGQVVSTGHREAQAQRQPGRAEREQRAAKDLKDACGQGGRRHPRV
jgi:hypothetical protein